MSQMKRCLVMLPEEVEKELTAIAKEQLGTTGFSASMRAVATQFINANRNNA